MRITNEMTNRMLSTYILQNQEACYDLQEQISSGKKILRPSDDPSGFDAASRLHDDDKSTRQFIKNAEQLADELKTVDGKLQEVTDILHRASEIIVSGSDGTKSPADLTSMGQEVNELLEDLVRIANANPKASIFLPACVRTFQLIPSRGTRTTGSRTLPMREARKPGRPKSTAVSTSKPTFQDPTLPPRSPSFSPPMWIFSRT